MSKPILAAMLSCSGTELTDEEKYLFSSHNPLGITLFSRNIKTPSQLTKLVNQIKEVINREDVLIALDEEGGRVSRLKALIKLRKLSKIELVSEKELGKAAVKYSKMHAQIIADQMTKYGLNTNYAPVVDKKGKIQSMVLQSRCFGSEESKIIIRAKEMIETYESMGICPCIKHLPGHFCTTVDPHLDLPRVDISLTEIYDEISYLRNFSTAPMAMTSHILLSSIDDSFPVTMSKKCIEQILRQYLGLDSFFVSDAIDMHALRGSIAERAENCWDAGIDAICYCSGKYDDMYNICHQKRFMTEKAQIRFAIIKKIIHNKPEKVNVSEIKAAYLKRFKNQIGKRYMYDATEVLHQMLEKGAKL